MGKRKTHPTTWKRAEGRVASMFGVKRAVLSGSANRADKSGSDSTHPHLYIEVKLRESHAARTLHDEVKRDAAKEGKVPVVALVDKNRPGFLLCVHSDDWERVLVEYVAALDIESASTLLRAMLMARAVRNGQERSL
jgi:hypothetical protein